MEKIKISINGQKQDIKKVLDSVHPMLELKESILISSKIRGGAKSEPLELDIKNDIIELVFDDDTRWLGPPDLLEDFYPGSYLLNRDGDSFELPLELENHDSSRNLIGKIGLKIFNLFAKKKVGDSIEIIASDLEIKQMGKLTGLVKINRNFELLEPEGLKTSDPFLLFIHGTNSSTASSFGELTGTDLWSHIVSTYGNNVLGFQHETLTKSPLQNALDLVRQLPENSIIHIVTHSRGGLVGEILCRFSSSSGGETGFTKQEIGFLADEGRDDDVLCIRQLQEIYPQKKIIVKKFIRVACPTSGTTLLSKRLDHFFNISLNLLGTVPALAVSPVYAAMKSLLIAIVNQKNDISVLPGLEAMKPDSAFITILNNQSSIISIGEPVVAISGNCKMKLSLKALVIIASKLFYLEDNDLVVNTRSMYNGSKRRNHLQYFFDEGTDVDHFHYFKNKKTNSAILLALKFTGSGAIDGFTDHFRGTLGEAERNAVLGLDGGQYSTPEPTGRKPIVVLLPGIMGSSLTQKDDLVWINYLRFLTGGLGRLSITENNIEAKSIIKSSYKKLGDALQSEYDVVIFPFDWRISLEKAAGQFNARINELLKLKQPIKIIGHSMGGVLVRDFMVFHPETWKRLNDSTGFRLIFLGSPLGGSFRINNVLFGEDDIIGKLSKIDIVHSKKKLLEMFSAYPGLLCLLPFNIDADNDFTNISIWNKMAKAFSDDPWPIPNKSDLTNFKDYRDKIINAKTIDFSNAVYIAGHYKHTPCGYRIEDTARGIELTFLSTAEGDQSVTWEMGIPKPMIAANTVYYVNYSHGNLANVPAIFGGIKEILVKGKTNLLSNNRPVIRSDQKVFKKPEISDFDFSPEGLQNTILGISDESETISSELPLQIKVSHGDLKYASFPVLAGHFKNDSILYSENRINTLLANLLKEQHKLGIYPGDIGTYEILLTHNSTGFAGAIIVGLGEPDNLTSFELIRTIEQSITKYLLSINDGHDKINSPSTVTEPIGITSLIIACGYGGLSIESSVNAILQGIINANAKIKSLYKEKGKLIELAEFIERYEDKALSCMYSVRRMCKEQGGSFNIALQSNRIKLLDGSHKQMNVNQSSEWWNRISITKVENKKGEIKGMRFSISTGAAREDLRTIYTSTGIVENLVESISTNNNWTDEKARAIFELLIPNDFKSRLKKHGNITWILDKYTARFPWELLQDNNMDAKPLCISGGMIRQLLTSDSRLIIEPVTENIALVIGDPDLNGFLTQLSGARAEAQRVTELLGERGYNVTSLINESADTIVPALVSSNYKIVHLAGHGIFNSDPDQPSGMVIGVNNFLTTAEIAQMSATPELVFVNCCFLGKTDGVAEEFFRERYKLAASIGMQLIENGVKAVIVAGWAVDDTAALAFAKEFYTYMLEGKSFGEAVRLSREKIYSPKKNTWGAYQCYGDPFYALREIEWGDKEKDYVISAQAEIELSNLLNDLTMGETNTEAAIEKLNAISAEVDKQELRTPLITEFEAFIFKSLNDYDNAIKKFEQLLGSENTSYSIAAIEQYCNIRVKNLIQRIDKENDPSYLEKEFDKAISDLDALIQLSPSTERYNLKGSAYKRKIRMYKTINETNAVNILQEASKNYYLAYSGARKDNRIYAYTNWITLEIIFCISSNCEWRKFNMDDVTVSGLSLQVIKKNLREMKEFHSKKPISDQYWDRIVIPNIKLCEWLLTATHKDIEKMPDFKTVTESYRNVWKMFGSKEQKELELQHLELLTDAINILAPKNLLLEAIEKLKKELNNILG
ncbi:CHAT domain-containing protein [Flavobacterium sp. ZS1P14]|uniref:CHAT domain-containing protein n=1 Tax=Flavobacterium sp. ZS1P14 TaxID=3401729 RepID=UPI003AAD4906